MFKNFSIIIFFVLFLSSCFWGDDSIISSSQDGLILAETPTMSMEIPSNWEIIKNKDWVLPKAKDWKIEFAVTSQKVTDGFANNILVLSTDLKKTTTSKDFSMLNNVWANTEYLGYTEIESKEFDFLDEEKSILYIFEAKYNIDTPKLKFLQTAHLCTQKKAFFMTLAIPSSVKDTSKYEYLLSTFKCK